jgi:hypothetical protein
MKTRQLVIILAAALVLSGLWFGRLAWRAHRNLVTLHARNMPLADVVRSLERQTWERIRFDKRLGAKITLNVKDAPLSDVLDLVADRAGARWQKTFAVGVSGSSLAALEPILDGDAKLDASGWTNLAPHFVDLPPQELPGGAGLQMQGKPAVSVRRMIRRGDASAGRAPGGGGVSGASSGSSTTFTVQPDGATDQWSSERLVLQASLVPQLGSDFPSEATAETAGHVATTVHGRSRLYYALEPSPFPVGGPRMPGMGGPRMRTSAGRGAPANMGDIGAAITQERREHRLRELSRSPEEQVEQARQAGTNKMQLQTFDEETK